MNLLEMIVGHPGASLGAVLVAAVAWVVVTVLKGRSDRRVAEVNRGVIRGRDGEICLVLSSDPVLQVVGGQLGPHPAVPAPPQHLRLGEHGEEVGPALGDRLQQHPPHALAPVRLLDVQKADGRLVGSPEDEPGHLAREAGGGGDGDLPESGDKVADHPVDDLAPLVGREVPVER